MNAPTPIQTLSEDGVTIHIEGLENVLDVIGGLARAPSPPMPMAPVPEQLKGCLHSARDLHASALDAVDAAWAKVLGQ